VLVVENVIVGALRQAGYDVMEASQADEARAIAAGRLQDIAIMVTDVVMPGASGPTGSYRLASWRASG
jgi:DNA-binding response OmpR family regulator